MIYFHVMLVYIAVNNDINDKNIIDKNIIVKKISRNIDMYESIFSIKS